MSAEDHIAIQQLLYKYCHTVDRGTADEVAALFHETAVLLPRYESDQRYEGREAIRVWYDNYMKNFRSKVRYLRHKIESPVIEISGNEAAATCYLDADSITISKNEPNIAFGRYDDKFIKENGQWWFNRYGSDSPKLASIRRIFRVIPRSLLRGSSWSGRLFCTTRIRWQAILKGAERKQNRGPGE